MRTRDPCLAEVACIGRCAGYPRPATHDHLRPGFCLAFAAVLLSSTAIAPSKAEEVDHHRYHDNAYRHWKQPGTDISCCSNQDCAPVEAEFRQGHWFALRQSEWFAVPDEKAPGQRLPLRHGEWILVPDDKIIRERNPSGEEGHLCYANGKVVCFVPPDTVR